MITTISLPLSSPTQCSRCGLTLGTAPSRWDHDFADDNLRRCPRCLYHEGLSIRMGDTQPFYIPTEPVEAWRAGRTTEQVLVEVDALLRYVCPQNPDLLLIRDGLRRKLEQD